MQTDKQILRHVQKRIRQIEQGKVHVLHHFTPRHKGRTWLLDCWCGVTFSSQCLDWTDLDRLIEFVNDHCADAPKGQS